MRVCIVGSGPSAEGFNPPDGAFVIAVNGAIEWLPRADAWFTLDPSPKNLGRMRNQRQGVKYYAAMAQPPSNVIGLKRIARQGKEPAEEHSPEWWLWRWSAITGLCKQAGKIHTGNSAWGALQLACQMGARKVALVGIDANSKQRIEGGNPNSLRHLPLLFNSAVGEIKMVNCGDMKSRIPKMTIEDGMQWVLK